MTAEERRALLEEGRVATCATIGPRGRPHLAPLWYVLEGEHLLAWTYAKSQKVRNLERDARATLQVEAGERYDELRAVVMECDAVLERDPERVLAVGLAVARRYAPGVSPEVLRAGVAAQAPKRVAIRFIPTRVVSWDHRKL